MDILQATDVQQITALLAACREQESECAARLHERIMQASRVDEQADLALHSVQEALSTIRTGSSGLLDTISNTCAIADSISGKVRQLDTTRTRLQQVVHRIDSLSDRKTAAEDVAKAMAGSDPDYEAAVGIVSRFLHEDEDVEGATALSDSIALVQTTVSEKLEQAARAENLDDVIRFAKLFPFLGKRAQGAEHLAAFLRSCVEKQAKGRRELLLQAEANSQALYVQVLSEIFETIATCVNQFRDGILEYFGARGFLLTLNELQAECDIQAGKVIRSYVEKRQLREMCANLQSRHKHASPSHRASATAAMQLGGGGAATQEGQEVISLAGVEAGTINWTLDELALISQRTERYEAFVEAQAEQVAEDAQREAKEAGESEAPGKPRSKLREMVQETVGQYVALEVFLMEENVRKAIEMDVQHEGANTSSVVDDVFFVLKKCVNRAVAFANEDGLCAVLNNINTVIDQDYRTFLHKRLDKTRESGFQVGASQLLDVAADLSSTFGQSFSMRAFTGTPEKTRPGHGSRQAKAGAAASQADAGGAAAGTNAFAVSLNNVQVSVEYVKRLAAEVSTALHSGHVPNSGKCECDVQELAGNKDLTRLLKANLELVFEKIYPRLKAEVDKLLEVEYEIDDTIYSEYEANDPFVARLINRLGLLVRPFENGFTHGNFDRLVLMSVDAVAARLRDNVHKTRFTQFGGLQLEKDVRKLSSFFLDLTPERIAAADGEGVRGKMASVTQLASVLSVYEVCEALDFCDGDGGGGGGAALIKASDNSSSSRSTLAPSMIDIKAILALRSDFDASEIQALEL